MTAQKYAVNQYPIQTLLAWVTSGEIAIPEIQRPFVWEAVKVRDLLDSLYRGYPVGYLIAWRNPNVRLRDGSSSSGKRILIDGQQRVTGLMAAILGHEVVTKDYETVRIKVGFNPRKKVFEVSNPAIQRDPEWIPDISAVFAPEFSMFEAVRAFCAANTDADQESVYRSIEALRGVLHNHVGLIELDSDLDIETVTEIFIRVNSKGMELSQADFAMSKIAANENYGGNVLRKAIDYFCHLAVVPEFHRTIRQRDPTFASTVFFQKMAWLRNENDDIYDPSYTDMLRVSFTSAFKRGRLEDLVALLSGRNFETKQYEDSIAEASFAQLKDGVLDFMNETHFKRFVMIIRSAGFVDSSLIGSQNALNTAYIVYLLLRARSHPSAAIERLVRRWFVLSVLTSRYSGSTESTLDSDIRQIEQLGVEQFAKMVEATELSDAYWSGMLPQELNTSSIGSPLFRTFQAAQVKLNDKGFLSRDITVQDLVLNKSDIHHIFPKKYLKRYGMTKGQYNQVANYAVTQSEINIAVSDRPPSDYLAEVFRQCDGGRRRFGGITTIDGLRQNLAAHCIPEGTEGASADDYEDFLKQRRSLMAARIREYFYTL